MLLMYEWLLPRASAVRKLDLNFSDSRKRRGYQHHYSLLPWRWVQALVVVVRAASFNLEALSIELSGGYESDKQAVLAAQSCHRLKRAIESCDRLKELDIQVQKFGGRLLSLLELGALPASLERLVVDAPDDRPAGTDRPTNLVNAQEGGSHLDLACLGRLTRLVHVHLHVPVHLLRVPAALPHVTSLHLSCKEMTFSQGLGMPDLQHLCLNQHDGGSIQLPALLGLTTVTSLAIGGKLLRMTG